MSSAAAPSAHNDGKKRRRLLLAPATDLAPAVDRLEFARDLTGYQGYLRLLEGSHCGVSRAGARWLIEPSAPGLLFECVVAKDNYETPAWLWRHYVTREALTIDAHASALNAVTPEYLTAADPPDALERLSGVGIWLNPAYGPKCSGIEPVLARLLSTAVVQRGCWLVALLPLYSFKTWYDRSHTNSHTPTLTIAVRSTTHTD